jgi:hypothetical protein
MVENIAYIYVMMFITAVFFPTFAAAFGAIFAFARVIYAHGYSQSFYYFFLISHSSTKIHLWCSFDSYC